MSKTFRPWEIDQIQLLPPSVHEFVPEGHVAHFVRDLVRESLDLSEIFGAYTERSECSRRPPRVGTDCADQAGRERGPGREPLEREDL